VACTLIDCAEVLANGYRPLRFTWEQVHHRADEVLAALNAVLSAVGES